MAQILTLGFTEGSGATTADSSGNSVPVTITGNPWTPNGKNNFGIIPTASAYAVPNFGGATQYPSFTVMMWYYHLGNPVNGYGQLMFDGEDFWFEVNGNTVDFAGQGITAALPTNAWTHVAIVVTGGTFAIFLNGVQASTGSTSVQFARARSWTIGTGGDGPVNGRIDEVRVEDAALTGAQIVTLMNTPIGASTAPPEGGFVSAFLFGPAAAQGVSPSAGSAFAASVLFGPASASGDVDRRGGFAASYAFGPAAVRGPSDNRFPRTIHSSGRYFLDQNGQPVLIKGDSPWSAFTDLSLAEWELWCENRASHGFNAGYISAVGDPGNGGRANGETYDGLFPFVGGNITAPNEAYWARVDQFFDIAAEYGITIFLYLIDSWNVESGGEHVFFGKSVTDCYTYGQFIGQRYGDRENVVWMVGGDYTPITNEPWLGATTDHQFDAALRGARDEEAIWHARAIQLFWQPDGSWSTQNPYWRRRVDFQHVYIYQPQYAGVTPPYVNGPVADIAPSNPVERVAPDDTRAPNGTDPIRANMPALFMEGAYEFGTHNGGSDMPADMRRQVGWALTSGSPGDFYGSNDWKFEPGWETRLDTGGVTGAANIRAAVEGTEWWRTVPNHLFVVTGRGTVFARGSNPNNQVPPTSNDFATSAVAADGSLALIYVPTQRAITINTSLLGASPSGTWHNAQTGSTSSANMASLTPPSSGDWLLVIQAEPLLPPQGDFGVSFAFGPATADGELPARGAFGATFTFGPATAAGKLPARGGFAASYTFGPASATGGGGAAGFFSASVAWGPAAADGESPETSSGGFSAAYSFGPSAAAGVSARWGGFTAVYLFGPAVAGAAGGANWSLPLRLSGSGPNLTLTGDYQ